MLGSFETPYFGGFGSSFNYKGIEVSAFFSFVKGNYLYNNDRVNVENPIYVSDNLITDLLNEWRAPGQITEIPRATATFRSGTTHFVEKGDFLRLRNASVAYNIPKSVIGKIKVTNARVFVQGQNLATWTDFRGYDPEINSGSLSGAQYPALRTVTFGLSLGL